MSKIRSVAVSVIVAATMILVGPPVVAEAGCAWGVGNSIYTRSYLSGMVWTQTQARLIRVANGRSRYYYGGWGTSQSYVSSTYGSGVSNANHFRTKGPTGNKSGWKKADGVCR